LNCAQRETHLIRQRRQINLPNIAPQLRLEFQAPLRIEQQVPRQPRPVLAEALIKRVVAHRAEPVADGREEVVEVPLVLLVVELAARLLQLVPGVVALRLEDVAGVEEDLVGVCALVLP
jgi:hypothetical protein